MSRSMKLAACAALIPLAFHIPQASGANTAAVELSKIALTVVDLDPSDGVNAQYWLRQGASTFRQGATACVGFYGGIPACQVGPPVQSLFAPTAVTASTGGALGRGAIVEDGLNADASLTHPGLQAEGHAMVQARGEYEQGFTGALIVEAHSRVTLSANYSLALYADNQWMLDGGLHARGSISVRPDNGEWWGLQQEIASYASGPVSFADSGSLAINLDNTTNAPKAMAFWIFADAVVYSPVPIPEPATWTLLFAGLASIGVATRRSRVGWR